MFGGVGAFKQKSSKSVEKIEHIQSCAEFIQVRNEAIIQDSLDVLEMQMKCVFVYLVGEKVRFSSNNT